MDERRTVATISTIRPRPDHLREAADLLGVSIDPVPARVAAVDQWEAAAAVSLPAEVRRFYASALPDVLFEANGDRVVPLTRLQPDDASGWLGRDARSLELAQENQDVVQFATLLGAGDDPPVFVTDKRACYRPGAPVEASPRLSSFVHSRAWDRAHLFATGRRSAPLIQAQASELTNADLGLVASMLGQAQHTRGWPGRHQFRFQRDDWRVELWDDVDQCDWWVTAAGAHRLAALLGRLFHCSSFRTAAWSNDDGGNELIEKAASSLTEPPGRTETELDAAVEHLAWLRRHPTEGIAIVETAAELYEPAQLDVLDPGLTLIVSYDDVAGHRLSPEIDETVGLLLRAPGVTRARREDRGVVHVHGTPDRAEVELRLTNFWIGVYARFGVSYDD